jgi:hypothetical protein
MTLLLSKIFFDRSDNVSFAAKGIPAPTFSQGFRSFDAEIGKYYHQVTDQADDKFNFAYLHRFCQAYIHAVRRIADRPTPPRWIAGDKYEPAFKQLYGGKIILSLSFGIERDTSASLKQGEVNPVSWMLHFACASFRHDRVRDTLHSLFCHSERSEESMHGCFVIWDYTL